MKLTRLPKDCLARILSLTSPIDVLRSSAVCKYLYHISQDDAVWDNFLPHDLHHIISQSSSPLPHFDSKKTLFLHLSHTPLFLLNNTQRFGLDKRRGKKCYTLGARALEIAWGNGDTSEYWSFESMPESGFPEVAKLNYVFWLEIKGKIHAKKLSPNTTYGAYLVFKMEVGSNHSFNKTPVKATVVEVDEDDEGPPRNNNHKMKVKTYNLGPSNRSRGWRAVERGDGWMEADLGRYHVGEIESVGERAVIEMTMWEVKTGNGKEGLVVLAIDLRPLD